MIISFQTIAVIVLLAAINSANAYVCVHPSTARSGASLQLLQRHKGSQTNTCKLMLLPRQASLKVASLQTQYMANDDSEEQEESKAVSNRDRVKNLPGRIVDLVSRLRIRSPIYLATSQSKGDGEEDSAEPAETHSPDDNNDEESIDKNDRQMKSADDVDFSGTWRPIVTSDFKNEYDEYLKNCSQSFMFRKVVVNGISTQKETIRHLDHGENLQIVASNPAGDWNRTLVASAEPPKNVTIKDPDGDKVQVEAWWEQGGKVHKSWLREKPRVKGGTFETSRYFESDDVLVCESFFHPNPSGPSEFKYGHVVWKFKREK